ncbi:MAG: hypothetical protein M3Y32_03105 [Pseudomonadota bacterium]|nr:hypothetical protein [Pseudomonadota bacterium]
MKMLSPAAMCLPPYIVFCRAKLQRSALGFETSVLMAYTRLPWSKLERAQQERHRQREQARVSSDRAPISERVSLTDVGDAEHARGMREAAE